MSLTPDLETRLLELYPTLRHLSPALAKELREIGVLARAPAGATVFEPADFSQRYPFLLEGTLRAVKVGSSHETLLYRLRPGDHCLLSAAGLLARWHFGARVVAEEDVRAVVIPGALLRAMVRDSREFAHSVYTGIARRLEVVLDLVEQATFFRLDQRVASLLLAQGGTINSSHQELADDLGASRENVSRVLEGFRDRGWVRLGRRKIELVDASSLESMLDREEWQTLPPADRPRPLTHRSRSTSPAATRRDA